MERISLDQLKKQYPQPDEDTIDRLLLQELALHDEKIVVLDDDPTGIQTVHNVSVYTDWSQESIDEGFAEESRMFYILTDSRGFTADYTKRVHETISRRIACASKKSGKKFLIVSRGDSTLRGHFPLETETIRETIESISGTRYDGEIIIPFFPEGGRYTAGNIHYVAQQDTLIPVGETEFARDKTFGFRSSDLRDWIEEKSDGQWSRKDVVCIALKQLRTPDLDGIERKLRTVRGFGKVVVNALDYCDLKVFCVALLRALRDGKNYLFRTAASLPKVLGGVGDRVLLTAGELTRDNPRNGGMVIVGSHVKKTTVQLEQLKNCPCVFPIQFNQHLVLDPPSMEAEVERVTAECEKAMRSGKTAVVYTRRDLLDLNTSAEDELKISVRIADALTGVVTHLKIRPGFMVAKGGITSSTIGVKALRVKKALVLGQIEKGIPVWKTGPESRFPGMPYVIFPGNVGEKDTLREVIEKF